MKLLLVEDEIKLGDLLKKGLEQEGYAVELVRDYDEGLAYAEGDEYDALILDRMLPEGNDGLALAGQLRAQGNTTPILILTARGEVADRVAGLDEGADDYLVKPFAFDELLARLRALTRRQPDLIGPRLTIANLVIDLSSKLVHKDGMPVTLSRREYALFEYLAHHLDQTISKDKIMNHVWDFEADILPNTIEVYIRSLRKKLDTPGRPSVIETVRGFGYRLKSTNDVPVGRS